MKVDFRDFEEDSGSNILFLIFEKKTQYNARMQISRLSTKKDNFKGTLITTTSKQIIIKAITARKKLEQRDTLIFFLYRVLQYGEEAGFQL
jgi:hypothetical protein